MDTIFAVSSGRPPAGIAVIRISGAGAIPAATQLAGSVPPPRTAGLRALRDQKGGLLDRALVLVFPGPGSATGEDLAELHCHGGQAVVAAVERALAALPGLRRAEPGEFTRHALINGRIDLAEAEGLADLLGAETERQRLAALSAAEGVVSQQVRGWMDRLAMLGATVEAELDFADEDDVATDGGDRLGEVRRGMAALAAAIAAVLDNPPVERLRDGIRVVLGGPPNSGKSTLINALSQRDVAIVSPIAGTTRDRVEAAVTRGGLAYVLTDTAGLTETEDTIEAIGVGRAAAAIAAADLLLWLGDDVPPREAIWVHARADQPGRAVLPAGRAIAVAAGRGADVELLWGLIDAAAAGLLPRVDAIVLHQRQREAAAVAVAQLQDGAADALIIAEQLRASRVALGTILGLDATESMLDALFGRFCIGK
jgi:tRNA modification GTPase